MPQPAVRGDARHALRVDPHVEGEGDPVAAELVQPAPHFARIGQCSAADHDAGDTEVEHRLHRRGVAQAAADLQLDPELAGERGDDGVVAAASVPRAVEVDDVQPVGTEVPIAGEQLRRVRVIARLRRKVALQQPHAAAALEIDGGIRRI